jgi:hypothetical protein
MDEKKLEEEFKNNKKAPIYTKNDSKQDLEVASPRNQSYNNSRNSKEALRPLNRQDSNESDEEPIYTSTTQRFPVPNQPPMLTTSAMTTTSTRAKSGQMRFSEV